MVNWKATLIGDYDWAFLCMPRLPCSSKPMRMPPFFSKDEPISVLVALIMGFQHTLAMMGGIITVPLIISGKYVANFSDAERAYLVSAALIVSGIASMIQVLQFKIPLTRYVIGSGLLSVMGISFTFLPIAQISILKLTSCYCQEKLCRIWDTTCSTCPVPLEGNCLSGQQAYGQLLGTVLVCCWIEILLSFMPIKVLARVFPPVVTGTTVLLIGLALCGTGVGYWGGGAFCSDQVLTSGALCDNNGEVKLPYGSPQYVGLGLVVFLTLVIVELFGSPFMRNIQVAIGLLVGMIVASAVSYTKCVPVQSCTQECYYVLPPGMTWNNATNTVSGLPNASQPTYPNTTTCFQTCTTTAQSCTTHRYVTGNKIAAADWITFLWVYRFPLGFYAPAVLPMLFAFLVVAMECIGDITATTEASGLVPVGPEYQRAIQGGMLADGLNCFWAALATMFPCTTYAQNNGIISLTRCAARRAGIACASFLIVFGIIQKFAAVVLTIPDCVLGGMTSFLFINVAISGMRILTLEGGINRRNRFIAAMALTLGVGAELIPEFFNISGQAKFPLEGHLWPINPSWSPAAQGFRDAIIVVLHTGFSVGGFTALILNLIIPFDADDEDEMGALDSHVKTKMGILHDEQPHPHLEMAVDPIHPHKAEDTGVPTEAPEAPVMVSAQPSAQ